MNNIKVLDNGMINKIAAGEVVERPLSVIKELIENSIDAGATNIEVEIKDGGTSFMRVTDNGKGIAKAEVRTAFLRHATSKISIIEDLESVLTMGFRGEALSSIAAVSQVEIVTKTAEQISAMRLEISGGEVLSEADTGAPTGTSITVRNLFAHVPARRKFLKKPATEGGYVSDIINKLAIGNPDIAFKYINNNSTILQTRGDGELKTVLYGIYGKEVANNLIQVNYSKSGVKLELGGYIGKPSVSRGNRNYSQLYINGRYVRSDIVQNAVEEAYKTKLTQGKFPFCVLRLKIAPETVDVNVHPTKLEVRFGDDDLIYRSVFAAVSDALKSESLIPIAQIQKLPSVAPLKDVSLNSVSEILYDMPAPGNKIDEKHKALSFSESTEEGKPTSRFPLVQNIPPMKNEKTEPVTVEQIELTPASKKFFNDYRLVGQVFNTYWLVEQNSSVFLIDQHAAHERVLYENLTKALKSGQPDSQKLAQPIIIPVSQIERQCIKDNLKFFIDCGFELEEFDQTSFVLYAVSVMFGEPSGAGFFIEILDSLAGFENNVENIYDARLDKIASIACKAAVKANDRISASEARGLIEQVLRLDDPFTCPHGRPTVVELSKSLLEKLFKRIQP